MFIFCSLHLFRFVINKNYTMKESEENRTTFSPKIVPCHFNNNSFSARKSRSRELVSATAIIQKCIRILSALSGDSNQQQHYMHLKDDPDPLVSVAHFIDQIYDIAVKLPSRQSSSYQQIQNLLQKQQSLNRSLIKKELEFREEHKSLFDELSDDKKTIQKLNERIAALVEEVREKDLSLLHLKNQLKACHKQKILQGQSRLGDLTERKLKLHQPQSKQLTKDEACHKKVHHLGHRRRNSQDVNRKAIPKASAKKGTPAGKKKQ